MRNYLRLILLFMIPLVLSGQNPELVVQRVHMEAVGKIVFSPNGRLLASASGGTVKIWEMTRLREIRTIVRDCAAVDFKSDSELLCADAEGHLRTFDPSNGNEMHTPLPLGCEGVWAIKALRGSAAIVMICRNGAVREVVPLTGKETFSYLSPKSDKVSFFAGFTVSPGGRYIMTFDSTGRDAGALWDVSSHKKLYSFKASEAGSFSGDDKLLAVPFYGKIDVWNIEKRSVERSLAAKAKKIAFSPTERQVALLDLKDLRVWDTDSSAARTLLGVSTGEERKPTIWDGLGFTEIGGFGEFITLAYSPDGRFIACGIRPRRRPGPSPIKIFDLKNNVRVEPETVRTPELRTLEFDETGEFLATAVGDTALVWTLSKPGRPLVLEAYDEVSSVAFKPGTSLLASGSEAYRRQDHQTLLWDLENEEPPRNYEQKRPEFAREKPHILALRFSPDGNLLAAGTRSFRGPISSVIVWDAKSSKQLASMEGHTRGVISLAFDKSQSYLISAGSSPEAVNTAEGEVIVWDIHNFKEVRQVSDATAPLAVDAGTNIAASGDGKGGVLLWDASTFKRVGGWTAVGDRRVTALAFSPSGSVLAAGTDTGELIFWSTSGNEPPVILRAHAGAVRSMAFRRDGMLATAGRDSAIRLWKNVPDTKNWLCTIVSFDNDNWAVVDAAGRFDTVDLDDIRGLHWIFPDDPFRTLAPEVFMRDYYEPRLLYRLLAGERFRDVPPLQELTRVQPNVNIEGMSWQNAQQDLATVRVRVSRNKETYKFNGKETEREADVHDVRLFRDGQLVRWVPSADDENSPLSIPIEEWRAKTKLVLDGNGEKLLEFRDIPIAKAKDAGSVRFSAYAFNQDRVKSATVGGSLDFSSATATSPRTAYVIAVGVNTTGSSKWDLQYAANDARAIQQSVVSKLTATKQFSAIRPISLVSDHPEPRGRHLAEEAAPTTQNLKLVLERLAGKDTDAALLKQIPGAEGLHAALPRDLVIITFSSHGYTDSAGLFHFLLADMGQAGDDADFREKSLSSDILSNWLRSIDAGEIVLIVDSCYSASTVEIEGFKPGPMGSRGLGQLAYDKGMRVLAASKARESAFEVGRDAQGRDIQQGLLTYALVRQGLDQALADGNKDGRITIDEWLSYGEHAVPDLFQEGYNKGGAPRAGNGNTRDGYLGKKNDTPVRYQQPTLFDFKKTQNETVLAINEKGR